MEMAREILALLFVFVSRDRKIRLHSVKNFGLRAINAVDSALVGVCAW